MTDFPIDSPEKAEQTPPEHPEATNVSPEYPQGHVAQAGDEPEVHTTPANSVPASSTPEAAHEHSQFEALAVPFSESGECPPAASCSPRMLSSTSNLSGNCLVGIRFKKSGQVFFFPDNEHIVRVGSKVLVEIEHGQAMGEVESILYGNFSSATDAGGQCACPKRQAESITDVCQQEDEGAQADEGTQAATGGAGIFGLAPNAPAVQAEAAKAQPAHPAEECEENKGRHHKHKGRQQQQQQVSEANLGHGKIIGLATAQDIAQHTENAILAAEASAFCKTCIRQRKLDMKLVDVEVLHDRSKIIFFFTAPARIDFRELVKDMVRTYRTRIELRQIGVRHETQMLGAIGNCGMVCCCHQYLRKFAPVTIKMAKEQNLFLNPAKLSGMCGRLLCCLSFEQENYEEFNRRCPRLGKKYITDDGMVKVLRSNMFSQTIAVLNEHSEEKEMTLDEWEALSPRRAEPPTPEQQRATRKQEQEHGARPRKDRRGDSRQNHEEKRHRANARDEAPEGQPVNGPAQQDEGLSQNAAPAESAAASQQGNARPGGRGGRPQGPRSFKKTSFAEHVSKNDTFSPPVEGQEHNDAGKHRRKKRSFDPQHPHDGGAGEHE